MIGDVQCENEGKGKGKASFYLNRISLLSNKEQKEDGCIVLHIFQRMPQRWTAKNCVA